MSKIDIDDAEAQTFAADVDGIDLELLDELDAIAKAQDTTGVVDGDDSGNVPPAEIGPSLMAVLPPMPDELELVCATDAEGVPLAISWRGSVLKKGSSSNRVRACKFALGKAGFRNNVKWGTGKHYGGPMQANVRAFQKAKGLKVDGQIGSKTFAVLKPYFNKQAKKLWVAATTLTKYEKMADYGLRCLQNAAYIHYGISGRMWCVRNRVAWKGDSTTIMKTDDCSAFSTDLRFVCGFSDPNGRGYDGQGYSGTMWRNPKGKLVTGTKRGGDCSLYGPENHATIWITSKHMLSHGCEAGPLLYTTAKYRSDYVGTKRYD